MTEQSNTPRVDDSATGRVARRGDHEPRPGTTPVGDLLAEFRESAPVAPPTPAVSARGLGLRTGQGWVFRGVDVVAAAGAVTAIVAPAGSGRSALLLALTGRMRVTEGTLAVAGRDVAVDPRGARRCTAVARVADLVVPEERLTVDESVGERCLIEGVRAAAGRAAFREACAAMSHGFDGAAMVEHLSPSDQAILALALAAVRPADAIVLDDTDRGVTTEGEREIYRAATALAARGPAVVTATARRESVPDTAIVVELRPAHAGPVTDTEPATGAKPVTGTGPATEAESAAETESVAETKPVTGTDSVTHTGPAAETAETAETTEDAR